MKLVISAALTLIYIGHVLPVQVLAQTEHTLPVTALKARKDTTMLCLAGCEKTGNNAWNQSRENAALPGTHDWSYCVYTATAMINRFYGGDLTRDEIAYQMNQRPTPDPELAHGTGVRYVDALPGLKFALNNQAGLGIETFSNPLTETQYKNFIDDGRPLFWECDWEGYGTAHAMVVAGYRYSNGQFQLLFLNTDNNGATQWAGQNSDGTWALDAPARWSHTVVPPANSVGRSSDIRVHQDSDGDGVNDFDEIERWDSNQDLDENNADTDNDGLSDGKDIEGWLFRGTNSAYINGSNGAINGYDDDHDGKRGELDPDSDKGGVKDGAETDTDPYAPIGPNADDIPKVKITFNSTPIDNKLYIQNNTIANFVFYYQDGTTALPVFDKEAGPLKVTFTGTSGASGTVTLTPDDPVPTSNWKGEITFTEATASQKAEFSVKNGDEVVEILEGKEFYIDMGNGTYQHGAPKEGQ